MMHVASVPSLREGCHFGLDDVTLPQLALVVRRASSSPKALNKRTKVYACQTLFPSPSPRSASLILVPSLFERLDLNTA
jgi:hypothetical protein